MAERTPADLDREHIAQAAHFAAAELTRTGVARVRLAPGDMTEYPILIAAPGPEWGWISPDHGHGVRRSPEYWVALCCSFGAGYPWSGDEIAPGYAAEKWTARGSSDGTRLWTGAVVADFLDSVRLALQAAR